MSTGLLSKCLRESDIDIGGLFQYIIRLVHNIPLVQANKYRFQLVNVTCSNTGMSFGPCTTPPKTVWPLSCTWFFTFSIDGSGYRENELPGYNSLRGINVRAWGPKSTKFLTVGIDHKEAMAFKLSYAMLTPRYAYFLLGMLCKSFSLRNRFHDETASSYEDSYLKLLPSLVYSSLYMMPLSNLISTTAYHLWVFNRHVWGAASYLLSAQQITHSSLLYYIVYVGYCESLQPAVEQVVLDLLEKSYLASLRSDSDVEERLLYTALVNRANIPAQKNWRKWLIEHDAQNDVSEVNAREHVKKLFYG